MESVKMLCSLVLEIDRTDPALSSDVPFVVYYFLINVAQYVSYRFIVLSI